MPDDAQEWFFSLSEAQDEARRWLNLGDFSRVEIYCPDTESMFETITYKQLRVEENSAVLAFDIDIDIDIRSDGKTVWVNAADGSCIGRFGRAGIDIHKTGSQQLAGEGECLFCTHEPTTEADYDLFTARMQQLYGVTVGPEHRPHSFKCVPR